MVHPSIEIYLAHLESFRRILQLYDERHKITPDDLDTYKYLISQNERDKAIQFFVEDVTKDPIGFCKFRNIVLYETSQSSEELLAEIKQGRVSNSKSDF